MNSSFDTNSSHNATDLSNAGATIYSPIIMFIAGMLGNILALAVLQRTRRECPRLMFHGLVGGLVWNDLLGILLTTPVTLASYLNNLEMPGGDHLCRFNGFVMICFGISTPLIVCAMAIERFLFVKYTFFYTRHCPPHTARLVILGIWGFVLLFGLLPLFGFGDFVLQYPWTWCFLDFKTESATDAAYGYLYALINLVLAVVMVVCNLTVVATLVRVRDYRRKHSTTSLNMSLVVDGEDSCRFQTQSRRRKQKDIELQMICVMFAITSIFAICWVPLMIHIIITLANHGVGNGVLALFAVRLASLNQTLNPWLYVILRRTLIVKVKKYCCRWRSGKRKKAAQCGPPAGRRHQYVHVGHRLCHRNNFVGMDAKSQSMSDSMRKSLQKALPAAMSLPDVMMVNTGRRDLDLPLPDVAKAQSFGGRVSHGVVDYDFDCDCDCPSHSSQCSQCARDKLMGELSRVSVKDNGVDNPEHHIVQLKSKDTVAFSSRFNNNNRVDEPPTHRSPQDSSDHTGLAEADRSRADIIMSERLRAKPPSGLKDPVHYRDFQSSIKNSNSSGRERHRSDSQRSNDMDRLSSIMSPSNRSSLHSQAGNAVSSRGAMTQYIHMQRRNSHGNPAQSLLGSTKFHADDASKQKREVAALLFSEAVSDDSSDEECIGNVFMEEKVGENGTCNSKIDNTTTDGGLSSSNPTESVCFSDTICGPIPNNPRKRLSHRCFDPHRPELNNECCHTPLACVHLSHAEAYYKLGKHERTRSKSYTNDGCEFNTVDWHPDESQPAYVEEEGSSGVFSVESPTKLKEEAEARKALWESKNSASADQPSQSKSHLNRGQLTGATGK